MKEKKKYTHLSFEERFVIEVMYRADTAIRHIAKFLSRSPNTVAREVKKNAVSGEYTA